MIVDSSALVAILQREPDADLFLKVLDDAMRRAERISISAATLFEVTLVIDRLKDPDLSREVDELLSALGLVVVDVTRVSATEARQANLRFGKGFHPSRLNFGDCLTYALAKQTGEPLLFKGNDFAQTDIIAAV